MKCKAPKTIGTGKIAKTLLVFSPTAATQSPYCAQCFLSPPTSSEKYGFNSYTSELEKGAHILRVIKSAEFLSL